MASEPFSNFNFLDATSILNCADASPGNYPGFDQLPHTEEWASGRENSRNESVSTINPGKENL
jgi:hypothetical protein